MNSDVALYWLQQGIRVSLLVAAPMLAVALAVGLLTSLFQAVTSIQEMTLSSIPKLLAVAAVLILLGPWMLQHLVDFTTSVFAFIPNVSR
ncbi:flagellar biosynthesis protein FliQ [Rubrivirga sp. S365]|uniref:Flagellar biosynthetic protein FliQ n=1 Tax=Rubrivirga litoralis TaxID=3075598 RepID=A0ABU3BPP1_9BACT|nr:MULTISPECIES: flagellar biosynthesis protein FliQ [unclassified Rubrivirga]MDT0631258.1 flagellar biosynthesis protein FliQ [Rubrivirga sp. F394]MDT7856039.1 flagellar biosynthesis protein FliQ [Rubrivirga sp. S365]